MKDMNGIFHMKIEKFLELKEVMVKGWIIDKHYYMDFNKKNTYHYARIEKETEKAYLVVYLIDYSRNEFMSFRAPKSQCKIPEIIENLDEYSWNKLDRSKTIETYLKGFFNNVNIKANTISKYVYYGINDNELYFSVLFRNGITCRQYGTDMFKVETYKDVLKYEDILIDALKRADQMEPEA